MSRDHTTQNIHKIEVSENGFIYALLAEDNFEEDELVKPQVLWSKLHSTPNPTTHARLASKKTTLRVPVGPKIRAGLV